MSAEMSNEDRDEVALRITGKLGFSLPPSARIEFADYTPGHDDSARLLLTMSQADWESLKSMPPVSAIDPRAWSSDEVYVLGTDEAAWQPEGEPELQAAQTAIRNGDEFLNVGFAPGDAGRVKVYIRWYQT